MQPRTTVEIELIEGDGATAPAPTPGGASLGLIGLVVVAVLSALVLVGRSQGGGVVPDAAAPLSSVPTPIESVAPDAPADRPPTVEASTAGAVDERWHRVWAAPAVEGVPPTILFTATPSSRRSAPPFVHVVGDEMTTTRSLDGAMWLEEPSIEWPGEVLSPFVQTRSAIVYPSEGVVWSQDLAFDRPHKPIADGVRVLAGATPDDVWVIGSGGRNVQRVDLSRGRVAAYAAPPGFPLAAFADGLVLRVLDAGRRSYVLWHPNGEVDAITVDPAMEFLGVGGDRAIFTDGRALAVHDQRTGSVVVTPFSDPIDVRRAAVSPDGELVALASRPDIVSFSEVQVVRVKTGALVDRFGPVMDLQLQFVDAATMQFMAPGADLPWEVTHRDVRARTDRVVAGAESPMLWFAGSGGR